MRSFLPRTSLGQFGIGISVSVYMWSFVWRIDFTQPGWFWSLVLMSWSELSRHAVSSPAANTWASNLCSAFSSNCFKVWHHLSFIKLDRRLTNPSMKAECAGCKQERSATGNFVASLPTQNLPWSKADLPSLTKPNKHYPPWKLRS